MQCPACDHDLTRLDTGPGPVTWDCGHCHGRWVPSFHYWKWLAGEGCCAQLDEKPAPPEPAARRCPECAGGLKESNAGRALAYQIDRCESCGGFWLDNAQLGLFRGKSLAGELSGIYGTIWRRAEEQQRVSSRSNQPLPAATVEEAGLNRISQRKPFFEISPSLKEYLARHDRACDLPPIYEELSAFAAAFPCTSPEGKDTLWQTVTYEPGRQRELALLLSRIYSQLKTGDPALIEHLDIERVDYCDFGNSKPFRVRVVNRFNDNYDHFYVKVPDASRIYGLELEHTLSPNRINYLVHDHTLIEEHIAGIPGDDFIRDHLSSRRFNHVRVAKEFVKFNERCFIRLLGDMRSYNYVVDITPDFEETQYRVRAIDFDQQSYEGAAKIYMPQFYKENAAVVKLCTDLLNYPTMRQYQLEERTLIARRVATEHVRLDALLDCMRGDVISTPEKVAELAAGLDERHETNLFRDCRSMGDLVRMHIQVVLSKAK